MQQSLISIKINVMTTTVSQPIARRIKPISFLFFRTETTVNELGRFFDVAPKLYAEAVKNNLHITGPVHWHYADFTDTQKSFTLEIALPVAEVTPGYDGAFHVKRTDDFACLSLIHEGKWHEMPRSYEALIGYAAQNGFRPSGNNREIYVNVDFANPDANVTEIQLGIL